MAKKEPRAVAGEKPGARRWRGILTVAIMGSALTAAYYACLVVFFLGKPTIVAPAVPTSAQAIAKTGVAWLKAAWELNFQTVRSASVFFASGCVERGRRSTRTAASTSRSACFASARSRGSSSAYCR